MAQKGLKTDIFGSRISGKLPQLDFLAESPMRKAHFSPARHCSTRLTSRATPKIALISGVEYFLAPILTRSGSGGNV